MSFTASTIKSDSFNNLSTISNLSFQTEPVVCAKDKLKSKVKATPQPMSQQELKLNQQPNKQSVLENKTAIAAEKDHPVDTPLKGGRPKRERKSKKPVHSTPRPTVHKKELLGQLFHTVGQLEDTYLETKRYDLKLQLAFDNQAELVRDLTKSLENEKMRNKRLMQLIQGLDSQSSTDDDGENCLQSTYSLGLSRGFGDMLTNRERWQSRTSMDPFDSISPLLLQQRFDELTASHKRCQRQLAKKEKRLIQIQCKNEELQAKYDELVEDYRKAHDRFEVICWKYLKLQRTKNYEMMRLREILNFASECMCGAKNIIDRTEGVATEDSEAFATNFDQFMEAMVRCTPKPKKSKH